MLAAIAAAAIVVAASLVLGQALLALGGRGERSPLAAGVGLAGLLVVCGIGAKLPGGGETVAVVAGVVVLGAAVWLVARGHVGRGRRAGAAKSRRIDEFLPDVGSKSTTVLGAAVVAALAAAIPFIVNDRVGILGVGLVNDDMANHLLMADWVQNGTQPTPGLVDGGYPLGPHSIAAGLADLLGIGLVEAFAGLTIAIAALAAITALGALRNLPAGRRTVAAALAALPYLGAAYLVQGAFKEPLQAILLITFALLLANEVRTDAGPSSRADTETLGRFRRTIGRNRPSIAVALPLGVVAAAAVYNYSFPGLFWLAGAAVLWWLATNIPNPRGPSLRALPASARAAAPAIAATLCVAALLTLPEWPRIADFSGFGAFDPAGEQTGLGNLRQSLNPLEALGVWPTGEFRLAPTDASIPAVAFYLAGLLGAAALAAGVGRAVSRRDEPAGIALLAALGAAAVIYLGAVIAGTPYTSAKALAIAAPVAMLLALRALLALEAIPTLPLARRTGAAPTRLAATALALAFAAAAAVSSFLVLRQAPVSPPDHADELAEIRPLVEGDPVLFLGRDDFIAWHLRGSPVSTHIQNFFSTGRVPARVDREDGEKFDFDAVSATTLDRFDWVLTSSTGYASDRPLNFQLAMRTGSYKLWKRRGMSRGRQTLAEGRAPGAISDCNGAPLAALSGVWPVPPAEGSASNWRPDATIGAGQTASQSLELRRGMWEISLAYDSPRPLDLRVTGPGLNTQLPQLPANLDFRGPTPPFPALQVLDLHHRGRYEIQVTLSDAPLAGRLLGAEGEAHLRDLVAVNRAEVRKRAGPMPCRRYVDWYLPG